jgi:hypothetical protein
LRVREGSRAIAFSILAANANVCIRRVAHAMSAAKAHPSPGTSRRFVTGLVIRSRRTPSAAWSPDKAISLAGATAIK